MSERTKDNSGSFPVPDDIPAWLWTAASDLHSQLKQLDEESEQIAQIEQDSAAGEYYWLVQVGRLLNAHCLAHERVVAYVRAQAGQG